MGQPTQQQMTIFVDVYLQWVDETIADIHRTIATANTPRKQLERAFEIWAVRPFEMMMSSAEAKELIECGLDFAQASLRLGNKQFEATITPVLATVAEARSARACLSPERMAHILASAVRGFKQTAATPAELRQLVKDLLSLSLAPAGAAKAVMA
jgi:TetR/AcrR family transcriptional regulator, regulator of autoinduction and epiphytic fitness